MRSVFKSVCAVALLLIAINAEAKEIILNLNVQSQYPIQIYYRVSTGSLIYGKGELIVKPGDPVQHIAVNEIGDDNNVLVQVYKMSVAPWTEINDPCQINLTPKQLTANFTVGLAGDPNQHGSFICNVAAS